MKWILNIVGLLLLLFGSVWILQGLNIFTQGFMAGHIQYAILGVIVDVAGVILLIFANRRRKPGGAAPTSVIQRSPGLRHPGWRLGLQAAVRPAGRSNPVPIPQRWRWPSCPSAFADRRW